MPRFDALVSPEYRAVMLALRAMPNTIQAQVRKFTKAIAAPEWKQALAQRADTRLAQRVLVDTAVVTVSNQNVKTAEAQMAEARAMGRASRAAEFPVVTAGPSVTRSRVSATRTGALRTNSLTNTDHQLTADVSYEEPPVTRSYIDEVEEPANRREDKKAKRPAPLEKPNARVQESYYIEYLRTEKKGHGPQISP